MNKKIHATFLGQYGKRKIAGNIGKKKNYNKSYGNYFERNKIQKQNFGSKNEKVGEDFLE